MGVVLLCIIYVHVDAEALAQYLRFILIALVLLRSRLWLYVALIPFQLHITFRIPTLVIHTGCAALPWLSWSYSSLISTAQGMLLVLSAPASIRQSYGFSVVVPLLPRSLAFPPRSSPMTFHSSLKTLLFTSARFRCLEGSYVNLCNKWVNLMIDCLSYSGLLLFRWERFSDQAFGSGSRSKSRQSGQEEHSLFGWLPCSTKEFNFYHVFANYQEIIIVNTKMLMKSPRSVNILNLSTFKFFTALLTQ